MRTCTSPNHPVCSAPRVVSLVRQLLRSAFVASRGTLGGTSLRDFLDPVVLAYKGDNWVRRVSTIRSEGVLTRTIVLFRSHRHLGICRMPAKDGLWSVPSCGTITTLLDVRTVPTTHHLTKQNLVLVWEWPRPLHDDGQKRALPSLLSLDDWPTCSTRHKLQRP